MLVHRIKATLLIDDFDIHKFLFKSAEINWHALKNFLLENVFHTVENTVSTYYSNRVEFCDITVVMCTY